MEIITERKRKDKDFDVHDYRLFYEISETTPKHKVVLKAFDTPNCDFRNFIRSLKK